MAKIIGIDLGTTYSAVSVWDSKKKMPVMIPNLQGSYTTPSVVSLNDAGEVIVGEDAKRNYHLNPANTVWQIKREMGSDFKVTMGGKTYNPQTISAFILRYLKISAEKYLGEPVHDAVITVPAYFNEVQHSATRDAGVIAGLNVHRLINEPTAAAIAYGVKSGLEPGARKIYAVYDLGGGTFDISIIDTTAEDITVVGTGGDPRLGGLDMDEEMAKWTLRQIKAKQGLDLHGDEAVRRRLMLEVEGVKKRLVVSESTDLIVPFLAIVDGKPFNLKLTITRPQYEMLIQKLLDRSLVCLDEAVASSQKTNGLGWTDLDGVLLVGGPTRLQRIRDMLKERFRERFTESGCPDRPFEIKCDLNPDEVVALGAAITAGMPNMVPIGKPPEVVEKMGAQEIKRLVEEKREGGADAAGAPEIMIFDVTGHSLGIAAVDDKGLVRFHRIIDKDANIPITMAHSPFTNAADFTTELLVQVFQGESENVELNTKIGEVRVSNLVAMPRGQQMLEVKFTLDESGTLSTICTDLRTNKTYEGTFKFDGITRMSKDEIDARRRVVADAMAAKSGGAPAGKGGQEGQAPPPGPGAAAPISLEDFPVEQVPADWKGYWAMGRDLYQKLDPEKQRRLALAMNDFADALKGGSAEAIEAKGYIMQDTIVEVRL